MAWFDVGAGLAEMGQAVAKTAGVALLEQQKSDLDKERLVLANELATERESRGRKEAHGYDMEKLDKTQAHQADQNEKDRQNRITTTGMSVGGQLASTRMSIDARREEAAEDRKLRQQEINDRFILGREAERRHSEDATALNNYREKTLELQLKEKGALRQTEDGTWVVANPATKEITPLLDANGERARLRDPEQQRALAAQLTALDHAEERLDARRKQDLDLEGSKLKDAQKIMDTDAVKEAQKRIDEVKALYDKQLKDIQNQRLNASRLLLGRVQIQSGGAGKVTGKPSPSDFDPSVQSGAGTGSTAY